MAQEREKEVAESGPFARFSVCIAYEPLRTEAPLPLDILRTKRSLTIPPRPSLDPASEALRAMRFAKDEPVLVLLPGRLFDEAGTRHGQGGGWYDRFLSRVPAEWVRLGVCFTDQLSPTPLEAKPWDEPVDALYVYERKSSNRALYVTGARPGIVLS